MISNALREEITLFYISLKEKKREGKRDEGIQEKKTLSKNIKHGTNSRCFHCFLIESYFFLILHSYKKWFYLEPKMVPSPASYDTPKWLAKYGTPGFYIEPKCIEPFRGSKDVALIEPFKVLYRTFSSKSVVLNKLH